MKHAVRLLGSLGALSLGLGAVACGDDAGSGGAGGSSTGSQSTTSATATSSTKAGATSSTTTGATSSTTSSTTGVGGGSPADHLVINEVAVAPDTGEFVEIWNPTAQAVDLSDYYLSDNSTYFDLASGGAWAPITNNPGTDFLARFPAGTSLAAGAGLVIAFDPGYEATYMSCPDLYLGTADLPCGNGTVPAMLETEPGSIEDSSNISNAREMLVLFTWTGDTAEPLQDVDYVTWGAMFENGTRVDKTGVPGYQPDTAVDMQSPAAAPAVTTSIERCGAEVGETASGGNGITGHDETSEDMSVSFVVQPAPTPGLTNGCP